MVDLEGMDDWKELLRREQSKDTTIETARRQLDNTNNIRRGRFKNCAQMFLQDGLVVKSGRILVPNSLKYQVTRDYHNEDHWGVENTCKNISEKYYWPNMKQYVSEYVGGCNDCTKNKHSNSKPKAFLKPQNWAEHFPRQAIALDLATMVISKEGYKYIMLITDGMSKFVELCPLRNITANSVVKQVRREWIARHGAPETLLTDQGQQVDGNEVRQLCEDYNIKKKRSSPYHPEGDGLAERQIGIMKGLFRTKLSSRKLTAKAWPELLPDVQLSMNTKRHASTKHTPFELMYGGSPRTRESPVAGANDQQQPSCGIRHLHEETESQKQSQVKTAQTHLKEAAEEMKKQYDEHANQGILEVGDRVYVKKQYVSKGESKKLSPLYDNLSVVLEVDMPLLRIKNSSSGRVQWRHYNQLKKCNQFNKNANGTKTIKVTFSGNTNNATEYTTTGSGDDGEDTDAIAMGDESSVVINPTPPTTPRIESFGINNVNDEQHETNPNNPPLIELTSEVNDMNGVQNNSMNDRMRANVNSDVWSNANADANGGEGYNDREGSQPTVNNDLPDNHPLITGSPADAGVDQPTAVRRSTRQKTSTQRFTYCMDARQ